MKAVVIALEGQNFDKLEESLKKHSPEVELSVLHATTPETISRDRLLFPQFKWSWPMSSNEDGLDMQTGLYKFCYTAKDQQKKIACSLSHMRAWKKCHKLEQPIIVFESDAIVTNDLTNVSGADIIGLNDPRKATRRSLTYHGKLESRHADTGDIIHPVPNLSTVGEQPVPHGLAGNSAYYMTPQGADKLLRSAIHYGMYPNDAFICKELFPWIRTAYPYYTTIATTNVSTTPG